MKNKLNYRLINLALICVIIYLVYKCRNLWLIIFKTIYKILLPFISAFFISYIIYPFLNYLKSKKIPLPLGIIIIIIIALGIIVITFSLIFPSLFDQIVSLINYIITFINRISIKYNIDLLDFEKYLYEIIKYLGKYISSSAVLVINSVIGYITQTFVVSTLSIYFLIDMEKIRKILKKLLKNNYRNFECVKIIDSELRKYFIAFFKIIIISFFEYSLCYIAIGHPNAIILGVLAALLGIIPYFGGIITNIIALVTSFTIGIPLFIKTLVVLIILSIIDGYVINPYVYGKSNKIHPLIIIFSCIGGNILGGILGMFLSLPLTIIIVTIIKYYRENIYGFKNKIKSIYIKY